MSLNKGGSVAVDTAGVVNALEKRTFFVCLCQ